MNAKVSTKSPSVTDLIEAAIADYAAATGPAKVAVRNRADEASKAAIRAGNAESAKAWLNATDRMVPTSAKKSVEIDWTSRVIDRAASLYMAVERIVGGFVPDGVPSDSLDMNRVTWDAIKSRVEIAWAAESGSDGDEIAKSADAVASAKVGRSVVRNDIQSVVSRAFDGLDTGAFLTVAEVATKGGTTDYRPSDGAIAARVAWTKSGLPTTLTGVVPVDADGATARGFKKA